MLVQYRNFDKKIITEHQALGSHYKDFIDLNGLLKIRESKLDSKVESVLYYKEKDEDEIEIVSVYDNINSIDSLYIREREIYGAYLIEKECAYFKNLELGKLELQSSIIKWLYNSNVDNISYEMIDPTLPIKDPHHRVVNKTYYLNGPECNDEQRSYITTGYRGYNETFDYMAYVKVGQSFDDQDIEYMDLEATTKFMSALGISQKMQNWFLNDDLLPPE
ncbi:hypothetical protein ACI6PS_10815 [Flavobacterium sp. PLA-1-15]|uniref:hypothetical protein n=1 Tax=Flavobacterium sp. PLA-1-15 TaxID=3380533 RepID=UPI003B775544